MNNTKILVYLLNNKEQKFTINQISKDLKINYRIAYTSIKELEKDGLVLAEKAGNSTLCSLTNKFDEQIFMAEYTRREELLKKSDFKKIANRFSEAKQNFVLLLFGSHAKKTSTKQSDIDLLVISENGKELKEIVELIPLKIHLTVVSYQLFLDMLKSKEISVGNEAVKNNVILFGIEDYYRMINNAK